MARIESIKSGGLNETDRLEIAKLLIKAGYTVMLGKEKPGNSKTYNHFVEYFEDDKHEDGPTSQTIFDDINKMYDDLHLEASNG
jgi:hypothetical protein